MKIHVLGPGCAKCTQLAETVATAAKELEQRGGGRCLISICTAGGMGVVAILER